REGRQSGFSLTHASRKTARGLSHERVLLCSTVVPRRRRGETANPVLIAWSTRLALRRRLRRLSCRREATDRHRMEHAHQPCSCRKYDAAYARAPPLERVAVRRAKYAHC